MNTVQLIKSILTVQLEGCKALLDLLQREKECLINFDFEAIEKIAKEKDTLLMQIKLYEEERLRLIDTVKQDTSCTDITIDRLYEMTSDEDLIKLRSQLKCLLQSIHELNESNRLLINRSLRYLYHLTDFFRSMGLEVSPKRKLLCREV